MPMDRPTINRLATGAGGSITLDGTTFPVGQPTDRDMATLGTELGKIAQRQRQTKLLNLTKLLGSFATAREFLDATEPAVVLDGPDEKANAAGFQRLVMTADGCRFLAWLLIRREQPGVTLDDLRKLITEDNASAVAIELMHESGMMALGPNSPGAPGSVPAVKTADASPTI